MTIENSAPVASKNKAGFTRSVYDALLMVGAAARVTHAVRVHRQPEAADLKRLGINNPVPLG